MADLLVGCSDCCNTGWEGRQDGARGAGAERHVGQPYRADKRRRGRVSYRMPAQVQRIQPLLCPRVYDNPVQTLQLPACCINPLYTPLTSIHEQTFKFPADIV